MNAPGSAPAYSGVQNSTASLSANAVRRAWTVGGSGSRSSSGSKAGSALSATGHRVRPGSSAAAVRSSAVFVEPARVLPETSRTMPTHAMIPPVPRSPTDDPPPDDPPEHR